MTDAAGSDRRRLRDAIEVGAALALAWPVGMAGASTTLQSLSLLYFVARIVWQDLSSLTIPDGAAVALAILGLAARGGEGADLGEPFGTTAGLAALDAVLCGGSLLAIREGYYRRRGHDGLGFGDVKLAAAGGMLVGTLAFAWALLGASLLGIAILLAARRGPVARTKLAFGAVLAPALWTAFVLQRVLPTASG